MFSTANKTIYGLKSRGGGQKKHLVFSLVTKNDLESYSEIQRESRYFFTAAGKARL